MGEGGCRGVWWAVSPAEWPLSGQQQPVGCIHHLRPVRVVFWSQRPNSGL